MDAVITTVLNRAPDPQRGTHMPPCSQDVLSELYESTRRHGRELVVLYDTTSVVGDADGISFVRVDTEGINPYFERWWVIAEHLATVDYDRVWCVDATDVEMLHDPFPPMVDGWVYAGSEPVTSISAAWLRDNHPHTEVQIDGQRMFNAGLIGGNSEDVAEVAAAIVALTNDADLTDMAAFNVVLSERGDSVQSGHPVHTEFRANDRHNPTAWWRHK